MLRIIQFLILLAACAMMVAATSRYNAKTKSRFASVLNSGGKESTLATNKPTSPNPRRLETTGCLLGSGDLEQQFGCKIGTDKICKIRFPPIPAASCYGTQEFACCKKVKKDHLHHQSKCLSRCDVRTSGLDNHAACRQRHPATQDGECRYLDDLFQSQIGVQPSLSINLTCCAAEYLYECPGTPRRKITAKMFCDQKSDCPKGTDEIGCSAIPTTTTLATGPTTTTKPPRPIVCTAQQFRCTSILQCVDKKKKCDMVQDCRDGSDEMTCTCADYLRNSNQSALICDDHVDCSDQSDEDGCRTCAKNEQYLYLSSQCSPHRKLCDKEVQNFVGVDELNCATLIPKSGDLEVLELNRKGKPIRHSSGVFTLLVEGVWKTVCYSEWDNYLTDEVCSYLGFGAGLAYNLVDMSSVSLRIAAPVEGFLWKSNGKQAKEKKTPSWHSMSKDSTSGRSVGTFSPGQTPKEAHDRLMDALYWAKGETGGKCLNVNVTCASQKCGTRPKIGGWDGLPNMEGLYPWHASVFVNDDYRCGATLISSQWLMITTSCVKNIDLKVDYAAVLLGARRFTPFANPNEQISRIIRIVPVGSHTVLLQMENPVQLTQYVNPICLTSRNLIQPMVKRNHCFAVGRNGTLLASATRFASLTLIDRKTVKATWSNKDPIDCPSGYWSGSVICEMENVWYAVAQFERLCPISHSHTSSNENMEFHYPYLDRITKIAACPTDFAPEMKRMSAVCAGLPDIAPPLECPGKSSCWRCPLGACLKQDQECDGIPNCRDRSDEEGCF